MSLYSLLNGVTPAVFYILPMLGKHPDAYPRFRDCFLSDKDHPEYDGNILVYTRTGGGNRESYQEANDAMVAMPEYVTDYDDDFDSTYATWVFSVPDKWRADFDHIVTTQSVAGVSQAYKEELYRVWPKLKEKLDETFAVQP